EAGKAERLELGVERRAEGGREARAPPPATPDEHEAREPRRRARQSQQRPADADGGKRRRDRGDGDGLERAAERREPRRRRPAPREPELSQTGALVRREGAERILATLHRDERL